MHQYQVKIHYHHPVGDYFARDMWKWHEGVLGEEVSFSKLDYFGVEGLLVYNCETPQRFGHVIIKEGNWISQSDEYHIELLPEGHLREVWLIQGDDTVYYSLQAAMTSHEYSRRKPHAFDMATHYQEFDAKWGYQGWLGYRQQDDDYRFKLWAPTANKVDLLIYDSVANDSKVWKIVPMVRGQREDSDHVRNNCGVWYADVMGNLSGLAYQYKVYFDYHTEIARDPYTIATSENGKKSAILSHYDRIFPAFQTEAYEKADWRLDNPCQAVVYEMHIRDLTISPTSGVDEAYRGTYRGAHQTGTKNAQGDASAFDYIKELGVNVVQLQPVTDRYKSYDEEGNVLYNWGYDVQNYSAPETWYSTKPHDPKTTMRELKEMIHAYHQAGISVVMDVVYNHIYSTEDGAFQTTVPDYYYRMNPDGSFQNGTGVGNETASEHEMYRKFMIDSLTHWVTEYKIDGFRFDLMGIHDVDTMNEIREAMDAIDPRILLYGEGWDMGTGLAPEDKAKKDNAYQMAEVGFFNDTSRDAIKGAEVFGSIKRGYVSRKSTEDIIARSVLGSAELGSFLTPSQVLNYVEAHDNYNLYDLLSYVHPDDSQEKIKKQVEVATAMNLLFQGMAFMQVGQEFLRTKLVATGEDGEVTQADRERAMNSYNAPDAVNQVDWNLVSVNKDTIDYIRQIIHLKKTLPALSLESYEEIYQHVFVHTADMGSGVIVFELNWDKHYSVIFNTSGLPFYLQNADHLELLVGNSRNKRPFYVENLTASVFEWKK